MGLEQYEDKVSERELRRLLGQRFEAEHLDFKEKLNLGSKKALLELCKDVIAMVNSGGGHLVFGVRDEDFEPVGLAEDDRLDEADLRSTLDRYVDERIDFLLAYHNLQIDDQQRLFGVLYVVPFPTPPIVTAKIGQYQDGSRSRTAFGEAAILVRSGSRSCPAQPKEVRAFFRDAGATLQPLYQLPEPPLIFKGRREEMERLSASVREGDCAAWAVQGLGGIGKTALALKLGQRLTLDYPDAQIFLDLRGTSSPLGPAEAMRHVIHTFHPGAQIPRSESECAGLYRSVLRGKRVLLVLDDAAEADQVKPLLPPASCALLVTSRKRFRLPGVQVLSLGVLDRKEAQDLVRDIAPRVADSVADIAELCGCLPLALELAATALAERVDLAPADYARRLRDKRQRLELVDASLSLSYDLLDDRLQRLWARLAVLSTPFDRAAVAAVWEMEGEQVSGQLGELLRLSLIEWKQKLGRYDLHELSRVFAYDKLEQIEDPRPVHALAAEHLNEKVTGHEQRAIPLEMLEEVHQWEQAEAWEQFVVRAHSLMNELKPLGYWEEIEQHLRRALEATEHLDKLELEAALLNDLGSIACDRAAWDRAIEMYEQSRAIYESVGDLHGVAVTDNGLGMAYAEKGEWDQAIPTYKQSLEAYRDGDDPNGMAQVFNNLGNVYADRRELDRAVEMYLQSLEIYKELGDLRAMVESFTNVALISADKGDLDLAIAMYKHSLSVLKAFGDVAATANICNNLGNAYAEKGDWARAIETLEESIEAFERLGDSHGVAQALTGLAKVHAYKEDWDRAIEMWQHSLETFERVGALHDVALACYNLGGAYRRQGEWDRAVEMYQRSLQTSERVGDAHSIPEILHGLGRVYQDKGNWDRAIDMYQKGIQVGARVGEIQAIARGYQGLGNVYADRCERDQAIQMFEESLEAYARAGDVHGEVQAFHNLGSVYVDKREWNQAIKMYEQSLEASKRADDSRAVARAYAALAGLYQCTGKPTRAIEMFEESLQIFEQAGEVEQVASCQAALGLIYLDTDQPDAAKRCLGQACLILSWLGSEEADGVFDLLAYACGSKDAANAYMDRLPDESDGKRDQM